MEYRHCVSTWAIQWMNIKLESKCDLCNLSFLHSYKSTFPHCRTKVFIRFPKTLFDTEDLFQKKKHELGMTHRNTLPASGAEKNVFISAFPVLSLSDYYHCQMEDVYSEEEVQSTAMGRYVS